MKTSNILFTSLLITLFFATVSCKKDSDNQPVPELGTSGVFIVNEGAFGAGNSSVSFLNLQYSTVHHNLFEQANGFPLGDVAQSMTVSNNRAYIIVNVSQKIEVVNVSNFTSAGTITGFQGPRYMVVKGSRGYVSDWFDNDVKVVDLGSSSIVKSIPAGEGPEQMLIAGNYLFVANVGGWGSDNKVTVINLASETVDTTLVVGVNPNSLKMDAQNRLWVLCGGSTGPDFIGGTADDIAGSLWEIDPLSFSVISSTSFSQADHPSKLQINKAGTKLFFLNGSDGYTGKIVQKNIIPAIEPHTMLTTREFYGLGIDPANGTLYGGFVPGFSQNGKVFRYAPSGQLLDSIPAGVAPNYFVFL
jgi:YVTN family beta-propeller protein